MSNHIKGSGHCVLYCAPTNKAVDVVLSEFVTMLHCIMYIYLLYHTLHPITSCMFYILGSASFKGNGAVYKDLNIECASHRA